MAFNQDLAQKLTSGILISTTSGNDLPSFSSDSTNFELQGTDWAMTFNSMTSAQRDALTDPVNGMVIYNTTTGTIQAREAGAWVSLSNAAGGVFQAAVGTAAAPGYTFTGDTNTGIYRSAADTIDFSAGGLRQFQVGFVAAAVNYISAFGAPTGDSPILGAEGSDASVSLRLGAKGPNGTILFHMGSGDIFTFPSNVPNALNTIVPLSIDSTGVITCDENTVGPIIYKQSTSITAAVFRDIFSDPIVIVPAPGAGKMILPHMVLIKTVNQTVAYGPGTSTLIDIAFDGGSVAFSNTIPIAAVTDAPGGGGRVISFIPGGAYNTTTISANKALVLRSDVSNLTGGDGTVLIDVWYSVLNTQS